jgi:hypothetical protein
LIGDQIAVGAMLREEISRPVLRRDSRTGR